MSEKITKNMPYPEEQKEALIKRMLSPENKSIAELSQETGINRSTLNNWKRRAKKNAGITTDSNKIFSSQQKFLIVMETYAMNEAELAAYCRSNGLYMQQINQWRSTCMNANESVVKPSKELQTELQEEKKKNKSLEKELQRKEKALAETAALLVLRKKWDAFLEEKGEE